MGAPLGGAAVQAVRAGTRDPQAWATVPVLVTARELPAGHRLTDADVLESRWPQSLVTESCATPATRARFTGQTVRWRVAPDTVLRDTDLIDPDPACAQRTRATLAALDGGTAEVARLGAALVERHEERP
ncbi:MAG: SAF domain-containing protein [Myxococcaceae bacterium]|nr:SAF domain-containing protein [Myxococcaceae bacterium]